MLLSRSRQSGSGVGHIPLTEIYAYIQLMNIDDDEERDEIIYFITQMDDEFIEFHNPKKK